MRPLPQVCRRLAIGLACLGAGLQTLLLVLGTVTSTDLHVGTMVLRSFAATVWLAVTAALLAAVAVLLSRSTAAGIVLALLVTLLGDAVGVWGLAVNGSAGTLPLCTGPS